MSFLQAAEEAARLGGEILESWAQKFTAREKSPANLVTEADLASQEAIHQFLGSRYPGHGFLGEEDLSQAGTTYRWVIDPLDGTSNYVHRFPYYAVSIGLEENGQMIAGAIFDPNRNEMFSAAKGQGAHLNGQPIQVSENRELSHAMCMASLPVKVDRSHPAVQKFLEILEVAQTVQRTGSAALNLCAVASGRIDAFWSQSLKPWDMAAGILIVEEAGGKVTKTGGGEFQLEKPDLLATNGTDLHAALVRHFPA
ncbi:inositol monophosphatase family protein [Planctomicrobium piriforme]|uniref:Inositol-1-monophosphatase n=1 Tax=Planctomicrobium piriforme TaxID=1576369 RepID=A0A1I3BZ60_9PLAN|nr:inositol monophosphatase family protein [Planctomicrobium piriforme]SFH67490.1 myo-inositol-1(or 4)-monophosphatase [Planctomicrobium piriforme]